MNDRLFVLCARQIIMKKRRRRKKRKRKPLTGAKQKLNRLRKGGPCLLG